MKTDGLFRQLYLFEFHKKQTMNFEFFTIEREIERQIYNILFVWIWYVKISKYLYSCHKYVTFKAPACW